MCGRFYQDLLEQEIEAHFAAEAVPGLRETAPSPRYNLGPGQAIWVVRRQPKTERRLLDALHWGLIPHFANDRKVAYRSINARAETLERAPLFRAAFAQRRCLVVAHGFYEWWTQGKSKHPYAFARRDQQPLALAGLWENWKDPDTGEWIRSCSIITTVPNALVAPVHDRMPVILRGADYGRWLGEEPASASELKLLLQPYAADEMIRWPVDRRMNRAEVDDVSVLDPLEHDPLGAA